MSKSYPSALPFFLPDVGAEEAAAVATTLSGGWLTSGPQARALEEGLAQRLGASHAVALGSCTAALHLAVLGLPASPKDVVLTSPYTFTAGAEVILHAGLSPVFSDIDPVTLNLDPVALAATASRVERQGKKIVAIMPTHIAGLPCDMTAIDRLAESLGCAVIEDAAHALPTLYRGINIGARRPSGHPLATCFSFYANKTLTTGEGGMLLTDDPLFADRCRHLARHGIDRDGWSRHRSGKENKWTADHVPLPSWSYDVSAAGFKYNLSDLAAAVGLAQLAKLDTMAEQRRGIADAYDLAFGRCPELQIPSCTTTRAEVPRHLYILRLRPRPDQEMETLRNRWAAGIESRGIGTSMHFRPLHLHSFYRDTLALCPEDFPHALAESQRALSLPIYSRMDGADTDRVITAVLASLQDLSRT
jgi:dTDP-4-amino-4,6-dideoxygalactose transaminase